MQQPLVFVHSEPGLRETKTNRRIVAAHIGKYHRNRSKPSQSRGKAAISSTFNTRAASLGTKNDATRTEDEDACILSHPRYIPTSSPGMNLSLEPHRLDPFQTTSVCLTPQMEPIFMYYFNTIMPVVEPVLGERNEYQQWLFPFAMSEPALLYAILSCMAHDIEQASGPGFGFPTRRSLYTERSQYKLRATRSLNECLADPIRAVKSSTLMAVHFLLWDEIFAGGELVQLEGVQQLLNLRGGFTGIQRKAVEAITVYVKKFLLPSS
ncbi:hypothetical protein PV08_09103 [Exophiala spinifera]|uniref:Transcription factor domain-containing protein n=1 Tax=Exophiala spinifera TaxID=91928 RepID=A0A0D2AZE1_9EURO|nr:uncharacterized protein PV08_09103 [Exophiala spinifera]KIW11830.1 hypothetical protein PV08_09103 [Exophiala spinifera]